MRCLLVSLIVLGVIVTGAPLVESACADGTKTMPCSEARARSLRDIDAMIFIPTPLFRPEHLPRATSPQWIAVLNNPTVENARAEALSRMYRKLRILQANALVAREEQIMIEETKRELGLENPTPEQLLGAVSRRYGLPVLEMTDDR